MGTESKNEEKAKIRPFNVMDQMVAHRLALEGFEIIKVVPSNKYAKEAHFIFSFNANSAFKKRFKELLKEVEKETADKAADISSDDFLKEKAVLEENLQKLSSENETLKKEICEKDAQIEQLSEEKAEFLHENEEKSAENSAISEENSGYCEFQSSTADNSEVLDKLAELQALGNCILSTVSAIGFQMHLYKNPSSGEG